MARQIVKCIYPTGEDSTAGIEIDAFFSEEYDFRNNLTDKPKEGDNAGGAGTVTSEPDELTVEAFIGATKFEVVSASIDTDKSDFPEEYPRERVTSAFEELRRLKETKQPMDIVTGLTTMTGMVITGFRVTRDSETGADLFFTVTFQKAPVTTQAAVPATEGAAAPTETGKSGTETPRENFIRQVAREDMENGLISEEEFNAGSWNK